MGSSGKRWGKGKSKMESYIGEQKREYDGEEERRQELLEGL